MLVSTVNSDARCAPIPRCPPLARMGAPKKPESSQKRKPPEPWQIEDAGRLRWWWDRRPRGDDDKQISQQAFGDKYDLGGQAGTWQYLSGRIPLNIRAVVCFAAELGCSVEDISPRLAAQRALQGPESIAANTTIEGIERLPDDQRRGVFEYIVFQLSQAAQRSALPKKDADRYIESAKQWSQTMESRIEAARQIAARSRRDPPLSRAPKRQKVEQ